MRRKLLVFLSVFLVFLTTFAYSALTTSLTISSEVKFRPLADIRINGITLNSASGGATIGYESDYTKNTISSGFTLPSTSSSISYNVHIDNTGDTDYAIYDIFTTSTSNPGVSYTISGYNLRDVIQAKTSLDLIITYTTSQPGEVNVVNTFDFRKVFHISYNTGTSQVIPEQLKYEDVDLVLTNTIPTKTGYTFVKWNTKADGTGVNYVSGATYVANESKILYAQYSVTPYSITYVLNGGTNSQNNPSTYTIVTSNITLEDATKEGYSFLGWTGNGTNTPTKNLVLPKGSHGNKEFTANFKDETDPVITVTNEDGSTDYLSTVDNINTDYGETSAPVSVWINAIDVASGIKKVEYAYTATDTVPSTGWTTTTNGQLQVTKAFGDYYLHVRATDNEDNVKTVTTEKIRVRYRVRYYDDYSTSQTAGQTKYYYYGDSPLTTRQPTKTAYTFAGWYDTAELTTKVVDGNVSYTPTTSIKLYGKWTPTNYTISYTLNGGTVSPANPTSYNVESSPITLTNPTKTGYTFKGWSGTGLSGDTNKTVTIPTGSYGNRTYTANYTANEISLADQTLNSGTYGSAYTSNAFNGASNGTGSYTYTLSNAPSGATINSSQRKISFTSTTSAGTYNVTVTATDNTTGKTATATMTITINKKNVTVTAGNASRAWNGSPLTNSTCTANSLVSGHTVSCVMTEGSTVTNVIDSPVANTIDTVTIMDANDNDVTVNYNITTATGTLTLTKYTPTVTTSVSGTAVWGQTLTCNPTNDGDGTTYTYQWYTTSTSGATSGTNITGATSKTYTVASDYIGKYVGCTATVTSTDNCNSASAGKAQTTKIAKKNATLTVASSKALTYPTAQTIDYTYDGDGTVTCSSANTEYVTCSVNTTTKKLTITPVKPTTSAVVVTLSAAEGNTYKAATDKTVSVTVAKGTLTATATAYSGTYDGSIHYATIKVTKSDWDGATIVSGTSTSYGTNVTTAGQYNVSYNLKPGYTTYASSARTIYYKITGGTYYNDLTGSTTVTINKKAVTVTAGSSSRAWNGSALTNSSCTATGLVSGHSVTCTMTDASTITTEGSVDNTINTVIIKDSSNNDVTSSYNVTTATGTLTITKATPTVSLTAKTAAYTGNPIAANTATATPDAGGAITYTYYSNKTCSGTGTTTAPTAAGEYSVKATVAGVATKTNTAYSACTLHTIEKVSATLTCSDQGYDGTEKTACTCTGGTIGGDYKATNYSSTGYTATCTPDDNHTAPIDQTWYITKRAITVTAGTSSRAYTATALTNSTCTAGTGELVSGQTLTCAMTSASTITNVGSVANTINTVTIKSGNTNVLDNYEVTKVAGTLTVTQTTSTTTLADITKTYNGLNQAASGATAKLANGTTISNPTITYTYYNGTGCSGTALSAAPKDAGIGTSATYSVRATLTGTANYATSNKCAKYTMNPATPTVNLSAKSASQRIYTGSPISANAATVTLQNSESYTGTPTYTYYSGTTCSGTALSGAPTNVGEYSAKATTAAFQNYTTGESGCVNHTITKKKATITVDSPVALTYPTAQTIDYTYDGDGNVTCESSSTTYVTCSVNTTTKKLTITPVKPTTSAITVTLSAGDGTNYSAADDQTVSVTVAKGTLTATATAYSGTYDGNEHYAKIKVTKSNWDGATIVSGTSTSYGTNVTTAGQYNVDYNLKPGYTTYASTARTVYYKITGGTFYEDLTGSTTVTINKKNVTVTAGSTTRDYNGQPLTNSTCTAGTGQLVSGHTVSCTMTSGSTITNAGSVTNTISTVTIRDANNNDVTANYNVTTATGTLTVNKADATCTINSTPTLTYPGAKTGNITYTCTGDGTRSVISSDTNTITVGTVGTTSAPLTAKKVGSTTVKVSQAEGTNYKAAAEVSSTVTVAGTIYTITLDQQSGYAGTTTIYEKYNTGYYLNSACTTQMTTSANPITVPSRTGYTFGGYYTSENGAGTQYIAANGKLTSSASTTNFSGNGTLYAKWTANSYTVTADANGGSISSTTGWTGTGDTATKSVTYNSTYGTLPTVSRTGYTLKGWSLLPEGYTQVEYIQSTGTQNIIFSGIGSNYTIYDDVQFSSKSSRQLLPLGGAILDAGTYWGSSASNTYDVGPSVTMNISTLNRNVVRIVHNGSKIMVEVNGQIIERAGAISTYGYYMFGSSSYMASLKRYGTQIFNDSGELSAYLIPCINESTGKAGLYDIVNDQFYGNVSTSGNDFTVPSDPYYITSDIVVNIAGSHNIYAHWVDETAPVIVSATPSSALDLRNYVEFNATDGGSGIVGYNITTTDTAPTTWIPVVDIVDTTTETKYEHDAAWARVLHQNNHWGSKYFTASSAQSKTDDNDLYSVLGSIADYKNSTNWEFLLQYPEYSSSQYNRWTQTSNPITRKDSVTGYNGIHTDWNGGGWFGAALSSATTSTYMDGQSGSSWWFAMAAYTRFRDGMPGPHNGNTIPVGVANLWSRIDNLENTTSTNLTRRIGDIKEDGTYYVWIKDASGNTTSEEVTISNVDTEKSTVTITSTNNVATSQTATITLGDNKALDKYYWGTLDPSTNNLSYTAISNNPTSFETTKSVTAGGTYYLSVVDKAGNRYHTNEKFYKTTLNVNGGSVSPASVVTMNGNSFTIPSPTKTGYTFDGWYTDEELTTPVTLTSGKYKPTTTGTIYAKYTANELTFNDQTLNTGTYGTAYTSNAFTGASNGTGSYTYSIVSGAPSGATIDSANRTISFTASTVPGTYNVVVRATDNSSEVTKDATMKIVINARSVTVKAGDSSRAYNGSPLTNSTCSVTSGSLVSGHTVTCTMTSGSTITNAGSVDNTISTYIIKDASNNDVTARYNVTTATGTLTVSKATCPAPTNVSIAVDKKVSWTNASLVSGYQISMSASSGFTAHTNGAAYNAITDATGTRTVYVRSTCDTANFTAANSSNVSKATTVYSVSLTAGTGISAVTGAGNYITGATAAIDATVSQGYSWANWTGSSTITTKSTSITVNGDKSYTANTTVNELTFANKTLSTGTYGTAYTSDAFNAASGGSGNYTYTIKSGAPTGATINSSQRKISFTGTTPAGTYSVLVTATDSTTGATADATMTIVINPKAITVTAGTASKPYDGTALTNNTCSAGTGELLTGHSVTCTMTSGSTITNAGSVDNTISTVTIKDASNNNVTASYSITKATGTLTVSKATCPAPTNVTIATNKKVSWTNASLVSGYQISMSASSGFTAHTNGAAYNAITDATGTRTVYVRSTCDTANFTAANSSNASKATTVYSVSLTAGTGISAVTGAGNYITGATAAIDATVSQGYTWANWTGTSTITDKAKSITVDGNKSYTANTTANALTFADKTLSTGTYGTAYTSTAFDAASNGSGNYTYTIKSGAPTGATINSSQRKISFTGTTAAGTYSVVVTATDGTTGATKDATMTIVINPKAITVTAGTSSKPYDTTALTNNTCSAGTGELLTGHSVTCTMTSGSTITNVGNVANTISTYTIKDSSNNNVTANYSVTTATGTLTVTQTTTTTTLAAITKTYNGTNQAASGASAKLASGTTISGASFTYAYYSGTGCSGTALSAAPKTAGANGGSATYSVKATLTGTTNYATSNVCATYTMNSATPTVTLTAKTEAQRTYTGSAIAANSATVTLQNSETYSGTPTYTYYSGTGCSGTALSGAPTNVAAYSVKATTAAFQNYKAGASSCINHTIVQTATTTTATNVSKTYDGTALTGSASAKYNSNNQTIGGATITYTYYNGSSCSGTALSGAPSTWRDGGYSYKATLTGTDNYSGSTSGCATLVINKRDVTVTAGSSSKVYDGTALTNSTCTAGTGELVSGHSVTCTMTSGSTITNAGSVANTISTYTIKSGNTDLTSNYNVTTATGTLTVSKATCPAPTNVSIAVDKKVSWTNASLVSGYQISMSSSSGFTAHTNGAAYNAITDATGTRTVYVRSTCDTANFTAANSSNASKATTVYSVSLTAGTGISAVSGAGNYITGASAAIDATVSQGYTWSNWTGTSTITDKAKSITVDGNKSYTANTTVNELTFANKTLSTGTYGTAYTSTAFNAASGGSGNYTYTIKSGAPTGATINSTNRTISFTGTTPAGTYSVLVTATDGTTGATADATMTIVINPKAITVTAGSSSRAWDGSALTNNTCSAGTGELLTGHAVTCTMTSGSTITLASTTIGTSASATNTISTYTIKDASNNDVTSSYDVTTATGTLTISYADPTVTLTAKSEADRTYTGSAIAANNPTVSPNSSPNITKKYYTNSTCTTGETTTAPTNVGTYYAKAYAAAVSQKTNVAASGCVNHSIVQATATNSTAISGTVTWGSQLTATITTNSNGTKKYQWYHNANNNTTGGTAITGATSASYTISSDYVGEYIYVKTWVEEAANYTASAEQYVITSTTVGKKTCPAPTNVAIATDKKVSWTNATGATSYQISMSSSSGFTAHTNGAVYNAITDATGTRTVYVRSVCDTSLYSSENSTNASKGTTVFAVSLTAGTGIDSVSGAGNYITGATATISATVSSGYTWTNWTGSSTLTANPISVTVNAAKSYTANATANTYTVKYCQGNNSGTAGYTCSSTTSSHTYNVAKNLTAYASTGLTAPSGWTFIGWVPTPTSVPPESDGYGDQASVSNLTAEENGIVELYAVFVRPIIFKSGQKGATTNSTQPQFYNPYKTTGYLTSVTVPSSLTAISNWTSLGYRDDTTATTANTTLGSTITPTYDGASTYYGVYSRAYSANFYSGVNHATNSQLSGTGYYNASSTSNAPSTVNITLKAASDSTDITNWTEVGWRDDTTAGDKEYDYGQANVSLTYGTTPSYYSVYSRTLTLAYGPGRTPTSGSTPSTTTTIYMNTQQTATSAQTLTFAECGWQVSGYKFGGWKVQVTGDTNTYSPGDTYTASLDYNATNFVVIAYATWLQIMAENIGYTDTYSVGCTDAQCMIDYLANILKPKPFDYQVGDYVQMTPSTATYSVPSSLTGYSSNQNITPTELHLWRVIKVNTDGTVDMVSQYVSSTPVYFGTGATGTTGDTAGVKAYKNFVGTLNTIANQYQNPTYTISARHMGYNGQTEYISDTAAFNGSSTSAPWTSSTTSTADTLPSNEPQGGGDTKYTVDTATGTGLVRLACGNLVAYKCNDTSCSNPTAASNYWLASRYYYYSSSTFRFYGRYVNTSGSLTSSYVRRYYSSSWRDHSYGYAIRPIVTLKSTTVPSSGTGVAGDPYVLN